MRSAKRDIVGLVKALAKHPDQVQITQIKGNPLTFEVKVCKEDLVGLVSNERTIQAIVKHLWPKKEHLNLRFLEGECLSKASNVTPRTSLNRFPPWRCAHEI